LPRKEWLSKSERYFHFVYSTRDKVITPKKKVIYEHQDLYEKNVESEPGTDIILQPEEKTDAIVSSTATDISLPANNNGNESCCIFYGSPEDPKLLNTTHSNYTILPPNTKKKYDEDMKTLTKPYIRRIVFIDMKIKRLGEIDTGMETFCVRFH